MPEIYDFSGWATKANMKCSDGRTILQDAFKECDGQKVPLVWNHNHKEPQCVLGHALLENRKEGVYAYCSFNGTESGKDAKMIVEHGDVCALSIYANQLQEDRGFVRHGVIREVSLVHAGANPGAFIDSIIVHSDGSVEEDREQGIIYTGEFLTLAHAEENETESETEPETEETPASEEEELSHAEDQNGGKDEKPADEEGKEGKGKTLADIVATMNEEQKTALYAIVGEVEAQLKGENNKEDTEMKHNVFDQEENVTTKSLSHSDGKAILEMAKANGGNSLKSAMEVYAMDNNKELAHADGDDDLGFANIGQLFPEYELVKPGAPEKIAQDTSWVSTVLSGVRKSPKSRLRVRFTDARDIENRRAQGYVKGTQKQYLGNLKLLGRTVDPCTVYSLDHLNRDDIIDITDFDIVNYMYQDQDLNLRTELARQILIGDGRNGDQSEQSTVVPIDATKIIPIWTDDELFTIHTVVDFEAARDEIQGSDTRKHFSDNYIYAEAILQNLLYARENYKGSGSPSFFCTPHLVNVMLLARDFNGRRIYDNRNDLIAAMNINKLETIEQFADKTRTVTVNGVEQTRRLLGILVNLSDYTVGATKGGEITHFTDFDIRFNQHESLLETRCSGRLTRPFSAIVLEEIVNPT